MQIVVEPTEPTVPDDDVALLSTEEAYYTNAFAAVYMALGLIIAMGGNRYSELVGPTFAFLFVYNSIWITLLFCDLMTNLVTQLASMTFAFTIGALSGYIVLKYPLHGNRFSAFITGFFFGSVVFIVVMAATGWQSVLGMVLVSVLFACVGLALAVWLPTAVPALSSAFLGTYVFTMSSELFFGGIPSEKEIFKMITARREVEFPFEFWVYVVVSIITFAVTASC